MGFFKNLFCKKKDNSNVESSVSNGGTALWESSEVRGLGIIYVGIEEMKNDFVAGVGFVLPIIGLCINLMILIKKIMYK